MRQSVQALSLFLVAGLIKAADFQPVAPGRSVIFYSEAGFTGNSFTMHLEDQKLGRSVNLKDIGWDDTISSLRIGEGIKVKMCQLANCHDDHEWSNAVELVGPYNSGFLYDARNDFASHIIIEDYDARNYPVVSFFGRERFEISTAGVFREGTYNGEDIKRHHLDKGGYGWAISSFKIPPGLYTTIYRGDHF